MIFGVVDPKGLFEIFSVIFLSCSLFYLLCIFFCLISFFCNVMYAHEFYVQTLFKWRRQMPVHQTTSTAFIKNALKLL